MMETCLIVGASSGLGRSLTYEAARRGYNLILISSDQSDLQAIASDVRIRFGKKVDVIEFDFTSAGHSVSSFVERLMSEHSQVSRVLIPLGAAYKNDFILGDWSVMLQTFAVNFFAPTFIAKEFLKNYKALNLKTIVLVSSISSQFPRVENAFYSAAKAALDSVSKSLRIQADMSERAVNVIVVRLGYLESQYTFGRRLPFPVATPQEVACKIFKNIDRWNGQVTVPRFWLFVLFLIGHLPWGIYSRMGRVK